MPGSVKPPTFAEVAALALGEDHPAEERVPHCPTCGKPGRRTACWACGEPLPVTRGRPRKICRRKECRAMREKFTRLAHTETVQ